MWYCVDEMASPCSEEVEELERERRGDVCVPAERLKNRAPSELIDSVSESSSLNRSGGSGILETALSSFWFRTSMLAPAPSKSECRADVRFSTMGSTTYLLVPYRVAAAPDAM